MKVPLETSTIIFSILLLLSFIVWYAFEKTLSIHSIFTKRRETFYWLTILFTFALGTASGDLMAEGLGLGYLTTGIIVAITIATIAIAWRFQLNSVLSFWLIYIMTRPLGASLGDLLSQPAKYGGLGLGATVTSIIFLAGILLIVLYFTFTKRDVIRKEETTEKDREEGKGLILQSFITIGIIVLVAGSAYFWRHAQLRKEIQSNTVTGTDSTHTTSSLGDLSVFIKITKDTRDLVMANDLGGAKTRVADLEYEWDNAQSRLKPMDGSKWTEIDDAIDKVLRDLRSTSPSQDNCKKSLDELLVVLN